MFDNIKKEIEQKLNERAVPTKGFTGYLMSKVGTERVLLSLSTLDMMVCRDVGDTKDRYCIVHKNRPVKYDGQYVDSNGHPVSIVTKMVFDDVLAILDSAVKKLQALDKDLNVERTKVASYELTLSTLRNNGVID